MGKSTKTSRLKVVFAVFQMVVFVVTMLYADAFGSANEQPVNTNSVFLGTESDQVGINPDNVNINISSDDDKSSIITYTVQKWDTLESVSQEFGITVEELKKVNKLSWEINPGQKLIVSDNEDGILYVVQEAKTLKLFAEYYRLNLQDLITLNYFSDESEVLYPGQEIFINVSEQKAYELGLLQKEQPVLPKDEVPVVKKPHVIKSNSVNTRSSAGLSYVWASQTATTSHNKWQKQWYFNKRLSNGFAPGYCTWYAAHLSPWMFDSNGNRLFGGNAKDWYVNAQSAKAKAAGIKTSRNTPRVWGLVIYSSLRSYAGHVSVIRAYYPDSWEMLLEDMNYVGKYIVTQRWDNVSNSKIIGYVHK